LKVGLVSRSFSGITNEEIASILEETGFTSTELCFTACDSDYWRYNGRSDVTEMTPQRAEKIANIYRDHGVYIAGIGCYTNLFKCSDEEMEASLQYFERHIEWASYCGIPAVATECGCDPDYRGINSKTYEADFDRLKRALSRLLAMGERLGVFIALESCVLDVVPSAKRARDLIAQLGSPNMKVVLDPANLIANSSERDMFAYLTGHIAYFHGKDRKVNDASGRLVGDGEIDWPLFLALYHRYTEGVPFILEYCNRDNCAMTLARVQKYDELSKDVWV